MTLRHFRIFHEVARTQNMSQAALQLNMSQPPVSQAIAEMEAHYRINLFDRLGRGIRLTPAGEALQSAVSHILALVQETEEGLGLWQNQALVRIGASMTVGSVVLPSLVRRFKDENPQVQVKLRVDNTETILKELLEAQLDLAVVEGSVTHPALVAQEREGDELVLAVALDHPWALRPPADRSALAGQPFFVRERGSGTRETFEAALAAAGIPWVMAGEVCGVEALLRLVSEGLGMSFLSRRLVEESPGRELVKGVPIPGLVLGRRFHVVVHKQKKRGPLLERLISLALG